MPATFAIPRLQPMVRCGPATAAQRLCGPLRSSVVDGRIPGTKVLPRGSSTGSSNSSKSSLSSRVIQGHPGRLQQDASGRYQSPPGGGSGRNSHLRRRRATVLDGRGGGGQFWPGAKRLRCRCSIEPAVHGTASIVPIRPCASSAIPAVKKRVVGVPATPLPKRRPHSPLIAMTLPSSFRSGPSKWPLVGL